MIEKGETAREILAASVTKSASIGAIDRDPLHHEAESGSLTLRLTGLLPRFPPVRSLRLAPVLLHARMSNLHGEFLSIHKISQAWPGVPIERRSLGCTPCGGLSI
jgi:hypothetical protein